MRKPDIICYDFDGTLCNTLPDIVNSMNVVLVENGFTAIPDAKVRSFIGSGISNLVERSVYYALAGQGQNAIAPDILNKVTRDMSEHYTHHLTDNSYLYDDAIDILEYFKDIPQVIVSNKPQKMVELMCRHYGIAAYFDLIIGGDTLDVCKPHEKVWEFLKEKMDLNKDTEGVMVGDSIPDMKFGKIAGFRSVAVTYGYNDLHALQGENPDLFIDSLSELKKIY